MIPSCFPIWVCESIIFVPNVGLIKYITLAPEHDNNYVLTRYCKENGVVVSMGHSIVVIEHHPDIIKTADWVIDMGPEGGKNGGEVVFQGTPEKLIECENSYTGKYLKGKL